MKFVFFGDFGPETDVYSNFLFLVGVDVANGPGGERHGHCMGGVGVGAGWYCI